MAATELVDLALRHHQNGNLAQAVLLYRQALSIEPHYAGVHNNLGVALKDQGQLAEAIGCYRQALLLDPQYADALDNLGMALRAQGNLVEAADCCRQALRINPAHAQAHNGLGLILLDLGNSAEALQCFQEAQRVNPQNTSALNNQATVLLKQGQLALAIACLQQALRIRPDYVLAHINLGNALKDQGKLTEAAQSYRQALRFNPNSSEAHYNLGNILIEQGLFAEAADCFRQALRISPNHADAHYSLGNALGKQGLFEEAMVCYREALRLRPNHADCLINLGNILKDQGRLDEAIACYQQARKLEPRNLAWHSNLLYTLIYHPGYDAHALLRELRRWADEHTRGLTSKSPTFDNDRSPDRRLRVGYVSPDFRDHPLGRNVWPLIGHHDRQQFEIILYTDLTKPDALTEQFRRRADRWCSIAGWPDERAADKIRQDRIDILVDLNLHMAGSRLLIFARKPAPVQVTFAGYPGSTGLDAIDYRLTDPYLDPPGQFDDCYAEKSIRLPHSFWCFDPFGVEPPLRPLPALQNGYVTFGCLNNFCKINDEILQLWSRVLRAIAGSRLHLLAQPGGHRQRTIDFLAQQGMAAERVVFFTPRPRLEYLALYHQLDIALDTLPCNGHATSLDSSWMGVPVVTLVGQSVVGRAGLSQLTNLSLESLAARTPEDFVRLTTELARDLPRLQGLRSELRERMKQSPLMDAAGFTRGVEEAYRQMWRAWCGGFNI